MPDTLDDRLTKVEEILADRRSKTFPVRGFERKELAGWNAPSSRYMEPASIRISMSAKRSMKRRVSLQRSLARP